MINTIKVLWEKYSMLIIVCGGLLGIFIIPCLFTQDWFTHFASYNNSGQIGDTIGGTTAPFIGLLSAVLVYRALQAQIKANEIIQKQIEEQEKESAERQNHESFMVMYKAYMHFKKSNCVNCKLHQAPFLRITFNLLKKELAKKGVPKWDNIRFFRDHLSEEELSAIADYCLNDAEGKNGLALVARKTGLFQHLNHKEYKKLLQEETDSEGFFNLEMTEEKYKNESVNI